MMEMLTNLVTQSGVGATQLSAILLGVLFLTMIIGLATGQELAFVLGGAGVIIGYLAWGGPGITIAMTKVYDQMQSYSMVAIPMFVLMANFLTHSKVADGLFLSIRYLLGPLKGGLGLAVIVVSTVFAATTGIVGRQDLLRRHRSGSCPVAVLHDLCVRHLPYPPGLRSGDDHRRVGCHAAE